MQTNTINSACNYRKPSRKYVVGRDVKRARDLVIGDHSLCWHLLYVDHMMREILVLFCMYFSWGFHKSSFHLKHTKPLYF